MYVLQSVVRPSSITNNQNKKIMDGFNHLQVDAQNPLSLDFKNGAVYRFLALSYNSNLSKLSVTTNFSYQCMEKNYDFVSQYGQFFKKPFVSENFDFVPVEKVSLKRVMNKHTSRLKTSHLLTTPLKTASNIYYDLFNYAILMSR